MYLKLMSLETVVATSVINFSVSSSLSHTFLHKLCNNGMEMLCNQQLNTISTVCSPCLLKNNNFCSVCYKWVCIRLCPPQLGANSCYCTATILQVCLHMYKHSMTVKCTQPYQNPGAFFLDLEPPKLMFETIYSQ